MALANHGIFTFDDVDAADLASRKAMCKVQSLSMKA